MSRFFVLCNLEHNLGIFCSFDNESLKFYNHWLQSHWKLGLHENFLKFRSTLSNRKDQMNSNLI